MKTETKISKNLMGNKAVADALQPPVKHTPDCPACAAGDGAPFILCGTHNAAPDLLAAAGELLAACAACFRVVASNGLADALEVEFEAAAVQKGFGVRAKAAIAKAKTL